MKILSITNHQKNIINLDIPDVLKGFYVAYAAKKDGKIINYLSSDMKWGEIYENHVHNDPIVSKLQKKNDMFSFRAWDLNFQTQNEVDFYKLRRSITNVETGLTLYHQNKNNINEYFAFGTIIGNPQQNELLINKAFVQKAAKELIYLFENIK